MIKRDDLGRARFNGWRAVKLAAAIKLTPFLGVLGLRALPARLVLAAALGIGGLAAPAAVPKAHADETAWFWCYAVHSGDSKTRNFYSNVFRGTLDKKSNYERAFAALVSARILKQNSQGDVVCFFDKVKGEARREQNEFALERQLAKGGTMEFVDWSY